MSYNKVCIIGNLGKDPELRYTPQGKAVCNVSVATTEKRTVAGAQQETTTWFKAVLWDKQAENASKYLSKGSSVYLEGRLTTEDWKDKQGNMRTTLEVRVTEMQFIGSKSESDPRPQAASARVGAATQDFSGAGADEPTSDDDIPF